MSSKRTIKVFPSAGEVAKAGAVQFCESARECIARSGKFVVALSGGSTPKGMFTLLAQPPFYDTIAWEKCYFFWSDERSVPPDHADSNYKMALDNLLSKVPASPKLIYRMKGELPDLAKSAIEYQEQISQLLEKSGSLPSFDLIYLGMGPDGHTASLFPHTTALSEMNALVVTNYVSKLGTNRITFTYPLINAAKKVIFLAAGKDKTAPLAKVLEGPPDLENYPSQGVRTNNGEVCWFVDQDAASQLSPGIISGCKS